jgi:hypothetical protein
MGRIGAVIPVVPVALVATVLREQPHRWFSPLELASEAYACCTASKPPAPTSTSRARTSTTPGGRPAHAAAAQPRARERRRHAADGAGRERTVAYYANSIAHLLPAGLRLESVAAAS